MKKTKIERKRVKRNKQIWKGMSIMRILRRKVKMSNRRVWEQDKAFEGEENNEDPEEKYKFEQCGDSKMTGNNEGSYER